MRTVLGGAWQLCHPHMYMREFQCFAVPLNCSAVRRPKCCSSEWWLCINYCRQNHSLDVLGGKLTIVQFQTVGTNTG